MFHNWCFLFSLVGFPKPQLHSFIINQLFKASLHENYSEDSRIVLSNEKMPGRTQFGSISTLIRRYIFKCARTHSPGFQPAGRARWAGRWPWETPPAASGVRGTAGSWWDGGAEGSEGRGEEGCSGRAQSFVGSLQHPFIWRQRDKESKDLTTKITAQISKNIVLKVFVFFSPAKSVSMQL